jgi:hypothetical protein
VENQIPNGVYKVNQYAVHNGIYFNKDTGQLIVHPNSVI